MRVLLVLLAFLLLANLALHNWTIVFALTAIIAGLAYRAVSTRRRP